MFSHPLLPCYSLLLTGFSRPPKRRYKQAAHPENPVGWGGRFRRQPDGSIADVQLTK